MLHRCITKFFLNNCHRSATENVLIRFLPRLVRAIRRKKECIAWSSDVLCELESYISGSFAEFYIRPILPCFGDVDMMFVAINVIAISYKHAIPDELRDCCRRLTMLRIIDSQKPGYVYLQRIYDDGRASIIKNHGGCDIQSVMQASLRQTVNENVRNKSLLQLLTCDSLLHGPAIQCKYNNVEEKLTRACPFSNIDAVMSIRCPIWPTQADWPTTYREHGWPDQTTINLVVNNACDVVGAVHPSCKDDEWERTHQWRLSFSRAEVTLLNSWTPVQQIVYHMLRFVLKYKVFSETVENDPRLPKLSNYHIKTLMLWECELRPQSWWSEDSSLIKLCSLLLYKLSDWVHDRHCQHYFISNCNVLDYFVEDGTREICNSLRELADETVLLSWFFEYYIRKCAQCCPTEVSVVFEDLRSSNQLERAVDVIVQWNSSKLPSEVYAEHHDYEKMILVVLQIVHIGVRSTYMKELHNSDKRLIDDFFAVTCLHVAYKLMTGPFTDDLLDLSWTLFCSQYDSADIIFDSSLPLYVKKAIQLGTLSSVRSNAVEMLHDEMAKAYLYRTFKCGQESYPCLIQVLLAVLYYKSGHYRASAAFCKQVLDRRNYCDRCLLAKHLTQRQCNCDLCYIGAECLPQISEIVDDLSGLILFYQYVHQKTLSQNFQQHQHCKASFSTRCLALYLYTKCAAGSGENDDQITRYGHDLCGSKLSRLSDVMLLKVMELQLQRTTDVSTAATDNDNADNNASSSMDTSLLATLLQLVALEKLINFRQVIVCELHCENFPLLNEFEVLHAYKCGLFQECLDMCLNYVKLMLRAGCSPNQPFLIAVPEYIVLLDGELLSLLGIIGLQHPVLFLLLWEFPEYESISMLTLSLYLMAQCQKKLRCDSLQYTLHLIRYSHDKVFSVSDKKHFFDRLILKLVYRSLKLYINDST